MTDRVTPIEAKVEDDDPALDRTATLPRRRARRIIAWVLVVLVSVMVPLSIVTAWAVRTVANTDRYVETLAPIARDQVITAYVADRVTSKLFTSLDVQMRVSDALPDKARFLAAPIAAQLKSFTDEVATTVLESGWFGTLWDAANRRSHADVLDLLTGAPLPAGRRAKEISVDLTPVLGRVIDQLDAHGVTVFDPLRSKLAKANQLTLPVVSSPQVKRVSTFFRWAKGIGLALPLATLVLAAIAVLVSVDRRKALLRAALGSAIGIVLFDAGYRLARTFFINHESTVTPQVTARIWDTITRFLLNAFDVAVIVCVVLAAILWLAGPSAWARWLRARVARAFNWLRGPLGTAPSGEHQRAVSRGPRAAAAWCSGHSPGLRIGGFAVAGLLVMLGAVSSVAGIWLVVLFLACYLVALELILLWGRRFRARASSADPRAA